MSRLILSDERCWCSSRLRIIPCFLLLLRCCFIYRELIVASLYGFSNTLTKVLTLCSAIPKLVFELCFSKDSGVCFCDVSGVCSSSGVCFCDACGVYSSSGICFSNPSFLVASDVDIVSLGVVSVDSLPLFSSITFTLTSCVLGCLILSNASQPMFFISSASETPEAEPSYAEESDTRPLARRLLGSFSSP